MKTLKFEIPLPKEVELALSVLKENGFQAYVVGGAVRDALLGKAPHDFDIAASSDPNQTMRCFPGYSISRSGLKHGTVRVIIHHYPVEITTFRSESGYSDRRHPDKVSFVSSPEEDSKRRDFTVNGFYYADGTVIDFHTGFEDLKNRVIRCIGQPVDRFKEDALRIMRAIRFSCQLGFSIEEKTRQAMRDCASELFEISEERIEHELLGAAGFKNFFRAAFDCKDVMDKIIPRYENLPEIFSSLDGQESPYANLAAVFFALKYSQNEIDKILRSLKFSNDSREAIMALNRIDLQFTLFTLQDRKTLRLFLLESFPLNFQTALEYLFLRDTIQGNDTSAYQSILRSYDEGLDKTPVCLRDLGVTGNDLKRLGFTPSPEFKNILEELLYSVNQEKTGEDRKSQLEWLKLKKRKK